LIVDGQVERPPELVPEKMPTKSAPPRPAGAKPSLRSQRGTDRALSFPSASVLARVAGRTAKLRCPNCGNGHVLSWRGSVQPRCSACNFRFERSDENYFSGAMFFGLLTGEFIFAIVLAIILVAMWPNIPWDTITWAIPTGMIVLLFFLIPASKVIWLAVDVLVRPVQPDELA
jgi:uncharacterized protein (DUF983 family)